MYMQSEFDISALHQIHCVFFKFVQHQSEVLLLTQRMCSIRICQELSCKLGQYYQNKLRQINFKLALRPSCISSTDKWKHDFSQFSSKLISFVCKNQDLYLYHNDIVFKKLSNLLHFVSSVIQPCHRKWCFQLHYYVCSH